MICLGSSANKEEPIYWDYLSTKILARLCRQDWPITAPFLDHQSRRGSLRHEMLAIAWLIALREEIEKAKRASMRSIVSFSSALGLAMMEW